MPVKTDMQRGLFQLMLKVLNSMSLISVGFCNNNVLRCASVSAETGDAVGSSRVQQKGHKEFYFIALHCVYKEVVFLSVLQRSLRYLQCIVVIVLVR
jgi:hypothetical protein